MKFRNYTYGSRIVSLAKSLSVKNDLMVDKLDFIYIDDKSIILFPDDRELDICIEDVEALKLFCDYDVFELWVDGSLHNCYDNTSVDNCFFVTGKCNSNCVMCPSPETVRRNGEEIPINQLIEIAKHVPSNARHLTITGGEPFMVGEKFFEFLSFLQGKFEETEFLILTNGRIFSVDKYASLLKQSIPNNCILAIPIHGSYAGIHDLITQVPNSFAQTVEGIQHLLENHIRIEIRIVVSKMNIKDFKEIINLICTKMKNISYVSIIAMEMTGSARKNADKVWIPYKTAFSEISGSIFKLFENGIDVKLYNFPLCTVDKKYWTICEKSISPNKIRYDEKCQKCNMKKACGGVFAGTLALEKEELETIYETELF